MRGISNRHEAQNCDENWALKIVTAADEEVKKKVNQGSLRTQWERNFLVDARKQTSLT